MITWIGSAGGPLILATQEDFARWRGLSGDDYALACAAEGGHLSLLWLRQAMYVVLGDAPSDSAFLFCGSTLAIARWEYCASAAVANELLTNIGRTTELAPAVEVTFGGEQLVLFDSAKDGAAAEGDAACAQAAPGTYSVTTEAYTDDVSYSFILHRFRRFS